MFKNLKRRATLLVVLAVSVATAVGIVAPAADAAANCTPTGFSAIRYDGQWTQDFGLACNGSVSGVQFHGREFTSTGMQWNQAGGGRDFNTTTLTLTNNWSNSGAPTNYIYTFSVPVFGPGCGAPAISVSSHVGWKIRNDHGTPLNYSDDTWGSTVKTWSIAQSIC